MAGTIQPLALVLKGESKTFLITVLDDKKQPVDITGATIEFQVNMPVGPPYAVVIQKSVGLGITILNQTTNKGQCQVVLLPADTKALEAKLYKYDVWVTLTGYRRCVIPPSDFPLREPVNDAP